MIQDQVAGRIEEVTTADFFFPVACREVANLMYLHLLCLIRVKYILMAESYFRNLAFDAIDQHKTSISCSIVFENSAYATFVLWVI